MKIMSCEVVVGRIIVPYGIKRELIDEFSISRSVLDKILLDGDVRD